MIKSMTGFGKSSLINTKREYQMEIKSVNHRYLDINIRMPRQLIYLEETIKKEIASKIKRGKIEVYITFENKGSNIVTLNKKLAKIYIEQLKQLAEETNISPEINVLEVAKMPDIFNVTSDENDEEIKQEIIELTNNATTKLVEMRKFEGIKIAQDLQNRVELINNKIIKISKISTRLIEEYIVKLEKRIKEILKTEDIDKNRLAQEVVIYADKCSIEEEITRLKSHIFQFRNLITSNNEEPKGKKIDFLIQEMNRETNTIGSKANNLEIVNGVIEIKTQLEDIREQVQNIE